MTTLRTSSLVDLPGLAPTRVDAEICVCARVQRSETGEAFVVVHTTEGFAFSLIPFEDQPIEDFYENVLSIIWPRRTRRTTK